MELLISQSGSFGVDALSLTGSWRSIWVLRHSLKALKPIQQNGCTNAINYLAFCFLKHSSGLCMLMIFYVQH